MIGQAAIGNPRIFTNHVPTLEEKEEIILKHLDLSLQFKGDQSEERIIIEFRKHLFQYIKGIPDSRERKQKVATITDYNTLKEEIKNFLT